MLQHIETGKTIAFSKARFYLDSFVWVVLSSSETLGKMTLSIKTLSLMKQHALKNVNNCLNTTIYAYLETSGGQSYNLYLNAVHFFNTSHH
jgi:hypothetical protein